MEIFVCVFAEDDFKTLQYLQYRFLKKQGDIYIFFNDGHSNLEGIQHCFTNDIAF